MTVNSVEARNELKKEASQNPKEKKEASASEQSSDGSAVPPSMDRIRLFRILFYVVMALLNWSHLDHQGCHEWKKVFSYYHIMWLSDLCMPTPFWSTVWKYGGSLVALLATYFDAATVVFAIMQNHYVYSYITNFVNHDYLFGLIAVLLSLYCYSPNNNKLAWLHALRGNICVVYFFAALWKLITPTWLDGTICKSIFTSFEEQGVASGVPWSWLESQIPYLFNHIAIVGLLLDAMLAAALLFLPIGHVFQQVGVLFHGFTAFTMAQRIGYAFPATMLASGLLFVPTSEEAPPNSSHAGWMRNNWRRYPYVTLWLLLQWLMPARMPFVSHGLYMYTGEGYRFSWTMMLHARDAYAGPGLNFLSLRPTCGGKILAMPTEYPHHLDTHSAPFERMVGMRGMAALHMFPRQLPHVAHQIKTMVQQACLHPDGVAVYGTLLGRVDNGPFHRLVDPEQDLAKTHVALVELSPLESVVRATLDKAPPGDEFMLANVGSYSRQHPRRWEQFTEIMGGGLLHFVDRIECLAIDPIGFFGQGVQVAIEESPIPLLVKTCRDLQQTDCSTRSLNRNMSIPPMASTHILVDPEAFAAYIRDQDGPRGKCQFAEENVLIKVLPRQPWSPIAEPKGRTTASEDTPEAVRLHELLASSELSVFRQALQDNPELAHIRSADGRGPMWWAVQFGHTEIVRLLLTLGVSHTERDAHGLTPPDIVEQIKTKVNHQEL